MSKRSYRRLAAVAGAALALGSAAPAMAIHIGGDADGAVDAQVQTIDVSDVLSDVQSSDLIPTGALLGTVGTVQEVATGTAFLAVQDVQTIVGGAIVGAQCLVGAGTNAVLGVVAGANAEAGLDLGLGGLGLGLDAGALALVGAPLTLVGSAQTCIAPLQAAVTGTVAHVQGAATGAAGLVTGTALTTVGSAPALVNGVVNDVTPLLLTNLLNVTASADAGALLGIF